MFKKGKSTDTNQRFTIRKYHFGAASVLIGTFFALGTGSAQASETDATQTTLTAVQPQAAPVVAPAPAVAESQAAPAVAPAPAVAESQAAPAVAPAPTVAESQVAPAVKEAEIAESVVTAKGVEVDGGKLTADATLDVVAGSANISYTIKFGTGYQPGDKMVLQFEENVTGIPADILQKQLKADDGTVFATLQEPPVSLYKNKDNQGSYWSQRNDNQTMDQKIANDIQNRGTLTEYTYIFTDAITTVQNATFSQTFKTPTQHPRIAENKEVTSVFRINGTTIAETTYTQKGEPLGKPLTGNFALSSGGDITLNSDNEFVSKQELITMVTNSMEFETGTTFKLKLSDLDMNKFKALGDTFPVYSSNAFGGSTADVAQINEHGVVLFGQRVKPKFQITSLTEDTLEFKLVEGKLLPSYTYQFSLKSAGAERTLESTTPNFITADKKQIKSTDGQVTVTRPDGTPYPAPTGTTPGVTATGFVGWGLKAPNISSMSGNFVEKHKALGNLAMRYVDEETGKSLIPSLSLINEQITDITKRKYNAITPAEDLTNPSTDTDNKTTKADTTAGDIKTLDVTPPYLIKDTDGALYTFTGYYATPAPAPESDVNPEDVAEDDKPKDPIAIPDAFKDGELKDANKLETGVQNIVATYQRVKMGEVIVNYVVAGNQEKVLKEADKTSYDKTDKLENMVGQKYDVSAVVAPNELTDTDGLVYVLTATAPTNLTGDLTEKTINVYYTYEAKKGAAVKVNYESVDGVKIGTEQDVKAKDTQVGTKYNTTDATFKLPEIKEGDVTYVLKKEENVKAGSAPEEGSVTETDQAVTYLYVPKQKAEVKYVLDTTKAEIDTTKYPADKAEDLAGETIALTTEAKIKAIEAAGYELVTDGFKADSVYDNDATETQTFLVTFKEKIVEVPAGAVPGQPVDPTKPDGPKWPNTVANLNNKEEVNQVVTYVKVEKDGTRSEAAATVNDKVTFTSNVSVNLVTGEVIPGTKWTADNTDTTFDVKKSPVVPGYIAEKPQVDEKTDVAATDEDEKYKVEVIYKPLGSYVVTPPTGDVVKTPYPNDPTDPTKPGVPTTVVPFVPGYTPVVGNTPLEPVDPKDPSQGYKVPNLPTELGEDTPIQYVLNQEAVIFFIKNGSLLTGVGYTGIAGSEIPSDYYEELLDKYKKQGHIVLSDEFKNSEKVFDNDYEVNQIFEIVLQEPVVPFDPANPPAEGTPIDPTNPEGPKWTTELLEKIKEYKATEEVTRTIKYVKEGTDTEVATSVVETVVFKRKNTINVVTKEITEGNWEVVSKDAQGNADTTFDKVTSPEIAKHWTSVAEVAEVTGVKVGDKDSTIVVPYREVVTEVPGKAPTVEIPEIVIASEVPSDYPTTDKPEIVIASEVPNDYPTTDKPEIVIASEVPSDYPTTDKPELTIPPKVEKTTIFGDEDGNTDHVYREVTKTPVKPEAKVTTKSSAKPAAKKAAKAGALPKTSATGDETNTALPAGLAAVLVAAGLMTARRRKENK